MSLGSISKVSGTCYHNTLQNLSNGLTFDKVFRVVKYCFSMILEAFQFIFNVCSEYITERFLTSDDYLEEEEFIYQSSETSSSTASFGDLNDEIEDLSSDETISEDSGSSSHSFVLINPHIHDPVPLSESNQDSSSSTIETAPEIFSQQDQDDDSKALMIETQSQEIIEKEFINQSVQSYHWILSEEENGTLKAVRQDNIQAFYSKDFQIRFYRETKDGCDYICKLESGKLKVQKVKDGRIKKFKSFKLKSIWIQRLQFGLKEFLRSNEPSFYFTVFDIKRFDIKEMIAERQMEEMIVVEDVKYTATKIHLTLKNSFQRKFWNGDIWYDESFRILKFVSNPKSAAIRLGEKKSSSEFSYR